MIVVNLEYTIRSLSCLVHNVQLPRVGLQRFAFHLMIFCIRSAMTLACYQGNATCKTVNRGLKSWYWIDYELDFHQENIK